MKKYLYLALMCLASAVMFTACDSNTPSDPGKNVDFDKMIGKWNLNSYTMKFVNTDDNIVEVDSVINKGQLTITKEKDGEGNMQYFYTENFLSRFGGEGKGVISIEKGMINLYAEDGFNRKDMDYTFEYTVSFPADNKMEWSYDWTGEHSNYSISHQDRRTVKAVFTKQ